MAAALDEVLRLHHDAADLAAQGATILLFTAVPLDDEAGTHYRLMQSSCDTPVEARHLLVDVLLPFLRDAEVSADTDGVQRGVRRAVKEHTGVSVDEVMDLAQTTLPHASGYEQIMDLAARFREASDKVQMRNSVPGFVSSAKVRVSALCRPPPPGA